AEDALQLPFGGGLQQPVHFLRRGGAAHLEHAVGEGGIGQGHPHRVAVQLAPELGEDVGDGGGGAGGGGDQALAAGPGAAQILVGRVEDCLGVGDGVDGGHGAVDDAEGLVDHLHHRRQAVGGAGGGGDDGVPGRIVEMVVDPHHHVEHPVLLHRRG